MPGDPLEFQQSRKLFVAALIETLVAVGERFAHWGYKGRHSRWREVATMRFLVARAVNPQLSLLDGLRGWTGIAAALMGSSPTFYPLPEIEHLNSSCGTRGTAQHGSCCWPRPCQLALHVTVDNALADTSKDFVEPAEHLDHDEAGDGASPAGNQGHARVVTQSAEDPHLLSRTDGDK